MKFFQFLKDKWLYWCSMIFCVLLLLTFLPAIGVSGFSVRFVIYSVMMFFLIPVIVEYVQKRIYYHDLLDKLEQLDQKQLLCELVEEPGFSEGKILHFILKQTGKAMNDRVAQKEQKEKAYREYIELWVHEVKTPIASSKLLVENHPSKLSDELLIELEQIDYYLEQVLFYSRSNSLEKDYIVKKVSLEELVQQTLRQNSRLLIRNHVQIQMNDLDVSVYTDVKWMQYVFTQIFVNAVKYRTKHPTITISAITNANQVICEISDNGIGIPTQDLPRLFERGFTGTTGRNYAKSTGMGLYLCKLLCDKLKTPIAAHSIVGKGTTMQIIFPKSHFFVFESK